MKNILTISLLIIFSGAISVLFGQWAKHTIDSDLYRATLIDVTDIDGDGDLDVAATGWELDRVVWYENNSPDTTWTEHIIDANLNGAVGLYIADIDGDGSLDVVAAGYVADDVVWYKNSGVIPITWTRNTIDANLDGAQHVYVADIDGDDTLDVVTAGFNADRVVWYKNSNSGQTWTEYTIDANLDGAFVVKVADIDGDDTLDVVTTGSLADEVVWYHNDGGVPIIWTKNTIDANLDGAYAVKVADIDGDDILDVVATARFAQGIIWYQNSGGIPITWTRNTIDANLDWPSAVDVADIDGDDTLDVFATIYEAGRVVWYKNNNSGQTWTESTIDANLNGAGFIHAAYMDDDTYPDAVVTGQIDNNVVWYENPYQDPTSIKQISDVMPLDYILSQNYPNPFNPITKIKYRLPELSFVKLKVFDVLGIEIATLVNNEKSAGNYSIEFNAANLPSGIYFYRLQAGDYIETKKMVLMK